MATRGFYCLFQSVKWTFPWRGGYRARRQVDWWSCFKMFLASLFFWERETDRQTDRQNTRGEGADRKWDTVFEAGSMFRVISTEVKQGFKTTNRETMTWSGTLNPLSGRGSAKYVWPKRNIKATSPMKGCRRGTCIIPSHAEVWGRTWVTPLHHRDSGAMVTPSLDVGGCMC